MRILFYGINYAPDLVGVAKYNTELCEWLADQGHDVRVITAPPYYPAWRIPLGYRRWRYRREVINKVSITRAPIYVPAAPSGLKRLVHHASFALSSALPLILSALRWRPDAIFTVAPSLMSCALAAPLARWVHASSWLHIQDFEVDAAFDLGLLRNTLTRKLMIAAERKILRSYEVVSTISPQMLLRLEQKGVDRRKTREMRNWIDTAKIAPGNRHTQFREELNIAESDIVALYSGTMSQKQGLSLIIEAAQELKNEHPKIQFIFCGEGPNKAELQKLAMDMRNVHFLEIQPNNRFSELLNTADIHIISQKVEATDLVLPSKLGGMFASGRPVIAMATTDSGLAEEVDGAGLVVPPGDVQSVTMAVRTLAGNIELRLRLGESARRRALDRWDKEALLHSLNIYQK